MNSKNLVKLSNIFGLIAITLLIYWVFVYVTVEVLGLKIFREKITTSFGMSILGILSLMAGALMVNIMFNLTRIADKHNLEGEIKAKKSNKNSKIIKVLFIISFPIILFGLISGDHLTASRKEALLTNTALDLVNKNQGKLDKIALYEFTAKWLLETDDILGILSKTDKNFPFIDVIFKDSIDGDPVYLSFRNLYRNGDGNFIPKKKDYIYVSEKAERDYFEKTFNSEISEKLFTKNRGNYKLYFPYQSGNSKFIILFSVEQAYGKL